MTRNEVVAAVRAARLIGIVRSDSAAAAEDTALALLHAGLPVVEVTLTTPGGVDAIAAVRRQAPAGCVVGAGTVLDAHGAAGALAAGAQFLVSPAVVPAVVTAGHDVGVPVLPGALTPTEVVQAMSLGADLVKLFPASVVGIAGLRALLQPLPGAGLVPTGGIRTADAAGWLAAGAVAVGLGGDLTAGSPLQLHERVQRLRDSLERTPRATS